METVQRSNEGIQIPETPYFIVTTGTGRNGKAHIPDPENGGTVCGKHGKNLKKVDAETVEKFYKKCCRCVEKV